MLRIKAGNIAQFMFSNLVYGNLGYLGACPGVLYFFKYVIGFQDINL